MSWMQCVVHGVCVCVCVDCLLTFVIYFASDHQYHNDFLSSAYGKEYNNLVEAAVADGRIKITGCPDRMWASYSVRNVDVSHREHCNSRDAGNTHDTGLQYQSNWNTYHQVTTVEYSVEYLSWFWVVYCWRLDGDLSIQQLLITLWMMTTMFRLSWRRE